MKLCFINFKKDTYLIVRGQCFSHSISPNTNTSVYYTIGIIKHALFYVTHISLVSLISSPNSIVSKSQKIHLNSHVFPYFYTDEVTNLHFRKL